MNKLTYLRNEFLSLYDEGDFSRAEAVGTVLLKEHEHYGNVGTLGYADDLYNLAQVYDLLGDHERAVEYYAESAAQVFDIEGESPALGARLTGLSLALLRLDITVPALTMMNHASIIAHQAFGHTSAEHADAMYNLGNMLAELKQYKSALSSHVQAMAIRRALGADGADIVDSLHSIAHVQEQMEDPIRAAVYAEMALAMLPEDHSEHPAAAHYLATLHDAAGKHDRALMLYDRVLHITEETIGREHSTYVNIAHRRACMLARMERPGEALAAHEEVLGLFEIMVGRNHAFYANCLASMAHLNRDLGDVATAEALLMDTIKIRRALSEDPTADILSLINLYMQDGRSGDALDALIYALMCASKRGDMAGAVRRLALALARDGKNTDEFKQAIELMNDRDKLLPIMEKGRAWEGALS
jgi:tetratricopeptide (TPR) repeat protein